MSYVTEYATAARSSRVLARPRAYTEVTRAFELQRDDVPLSVHLDPSGSHVVVRVDSGLIFLDSRRRIGNGTFRGFPYVVDWGALLGEIEMRWDGLTRDGRVDHRESVPTYRVRIQSGFELAARLTPTRWTSVGQQIGSFGLPTEVSIYSRSSTDEWMDVIPDLAAAAIGDDDRVVIGTKRGTLRTYAADGDARDMRGVPRGEFSVDEPIHAVSLTPANTVALSERLGATAVRFTDEQRVLWSVEIPFAVRQPAIDGGEDRVYLVGDGVAAIVGGVIAWSLSSVISARATAFVDGTLAVCRGPGLQIIARDGSIVQQLATSDGAPIVTPPAIGPDGSIWVATPTHVCVAR
jgi:hypothetical protein